MTLLKLLAFANEGITAGSIDPETEVMVAQPFDTAAYPVFGLTVLTAQDEGGEPRKVVVLTVNMSTDDPETSN